MCSYTYDYTFEISLSTRSFSCCCFIFFSNCDWGKCDNYWAFYWIIKMVCVVYASCWGDIRAIYTTHEFIINLKDLPLLPPLSILLTTICTPYIYAHNNDNIQRGEKKSFWGKHREVTQLKSENSTRKIHSE